MCFSATASFGASFLLFIIGFMTCAQIKKRSYTLMCLTPLLFALQQFAEGVVWLTLGSLQSSLLQAIAAYFFMFFAYCIWPLWIPLSLYLVEPQELRKKILQVLTTVGAIVGMYLLYVLCTRPMHVQAYEHHIAYGISNCAFMEYFMDALYLVATVGAFFTSSLAGMRLMGIMGMAFAIFSYYYAYCCFGSVWCFFAAILSLFLYWIVRRANYVGTAF